MILSAFSTNNLPERVSDSTPIFLERTITLLLQSVLYWALLSPLDPSGIEECVEFFLPPS